MSEFKHTISDINLPERLRLLLNEANMTQKDLCETIKINPSMMSNYMTGNTLPTVDKVCDMAKYFKVSVEYLLGLEDMKTGDVNVQALIEQTGLSEAAVSRIMENKAMAFEDMTLLTNDVISWMLEDSTFLRLMQLMVEYCFYQETSYDENIEMALSGSLSKELPREIQSIIGNTYSSDKGYAKQQLLYSARERIISSFAGGLDVYHHRFSSMDHRVRRNYKAGLLSRSHVVLDTLYNGIAEKKIRARTEETTAVYKKSLQVALEDGIRALSGSNLVGEKSEEDEVTAEIKSKMSDAVFSVIEKVPEIVMKYYNEVRLRNGKY